MYILWMTPIPHTIFMCTNMIFLFYSIIFSVFIHIVLACTDAAVGSTLLQLLATDADAGTTILYYMSATWLINSPPAEMFRVINYT